MEIVKQDIQDISQIRPLWEELNNFHSQLSTHFKEHFESFKFDSRLKQIENKESFAIFVAKEGSEFLGYCIVSIDKQVGEIESIYIKPQNRNSKLGKNLIAVAESWLKSKEIVKILISVAEGNESVFGFYNRRGYYQRYTVLEKKV